MIDGAMLFYSIDASGKSTGSETFWMPYAGVSVVVLMLVSVFAKAPMPDPQVRGTRNLGRDERCQRSWCVSPHGRHSPLAESRCAIPVHGNDRLGECLYCFREFVSARLCANHLHGASPAFPCDVVSSEKIVFRVDLVSPSFFRSDAGPVGEICVFYKLHDHPAAGA